MPFYRSDAFNLRCPLVVAFGLTSEMGQQVTELKSELGRRGLSQTGLKFDLAQRLQTAMDVDEFGALPSLTSPSDSSSPLVPVCVTVDATARI